MQLLSNTLRAVHMGLVGKRVWRRELAALRESTDPLSRCVARALETTLAHDVTAEEASWVRRIEAIRRELCASKQPLVAERSPAARQRGKDPTVGDVCHRASKSPLWALLLLKIVRELRPACCLEMGTCLGISAAYQAAALAINGRGSLITLEGAANRAAIARRTFERLGLDNVQLAEGSFRDTLGEVLARSDRFEYVFVDGHHKRDATLSYFEQILPHLADRAIMVFDDISWSQEMKEAWCAIRTDPRLARCIDLRAIGICAIDRAAA